MYHQWSTVRVDTSSQSSSWSPQGMHSQQCNCHCSLASSLLMKHRTIQPGSWSTPMRHQWSTVRVDTPMQWRLSNQQDSSNPRYTSHCSLRTPLLMNYRNIQPSSWNTRTHHYWNTAPVDTSPQSSLWSPQDMHSQQCSRHCSLQTSGHRRCRTYRRHTVRYSLPMSAQSCYHSGLDTTTARISR